MKAMSLPSDLIDLVDYLVNEVLDGRNQHLANGVQRALGRPPRPFSRFARMASETDVWRAAIHS